MRSIRLCLCWNRQRGDIWIRIQKTQNTDSAAKTMSGHDCLTGLGDTVAIHFPWTHTWDWRQCLQGGKNQLNSGYQLYRTRLFQYCFFVSYLDQTSFYHTYLSIIIVYLIHIVLLFWLRVNYLLRALRYQYFWLKLFYVTQWYRHTYSLFIAIIIILLHRAWH